MNELPITFERNLYRAVIRYKKDHPGMLEGITAARHAREAGICHRGMGAEGAGGEAGKADREEGTEEITAVPVHPPGTAETWADHQQSETEGHERSIKRWTM